MTNKLPTKRGTKFFLAEDIRTESSGKFTALGVFPGERLMVKVAPTVSAGAPPIVLQSLAFAFVLSDGEGHFSGRFKIVAPDKKTIIADVPIGSIEILKGQPATIASTSKPFHAPGVGTYSAKLEVGKAKLSFPFIIIEAKEPSAAK